MRITFLEAATPLAKKFTANGPVSYPLAKNFTSYEHEIDVSNEGMRDKFEYIKYHAARGHCLYKGNLTQKLDNMSRAGLTNKAEKTESIILDIDGLPCSTPIPHPIRKHDLVHLTETFISELPQCFHKASYITHASASMGMKGKRLNLHIEFFLDRPMSPRALKDVLLTLNFEHKNAKDNLNLTASGTALNYPIDVCLADNSRIIYISAPEFEDGIDNPFENDDERIEFVEKDEATVNLLPILELYNSEQLAKKVADQVRAIRKAQGLPSKKSQLKTLRFQRENGPNEELDLVVNPDQINLEFVSDNGQWLQFNRLGGDSRGYYVDKKSPNVLRNFKGEDFVLLPKADPDTYEWIMSNFGGATERTAEPFAFRDYNTNTIYNGFYDPATNELTKAELRATSLVNVQDFFAYYGHIPPEVLPQMDCFYKPPEKSGIDWDNNTVNRFRPSVYMRDASPEGLSRELILEFGSAGDDLNKICPQTASVIWHVLGNNEEAFELFINWLAYIFQKRDKTGTAWLLHGVPGTGKGILTSNIIKPLFGDSFSQKTVRNLDDDKCKWMEEKLFVVVNEFQYENSRNWNSTSEMLKMAITDHTITVRAMHQNQYDSVNWLNFLFCSNHRDAIRIEEGDRRYNIPPRQEQQLKELIPDIPKLLGDIEAELPMLANYMSGYNVNHEAAHTPWDNDEKRQLQETTQTSVEEFCSALREGDLEYFLPLLEMPTVTDIQFDVKRVITPVLRAWLRESNNKADVGYTKSRISIDDLTLIFNADGSSGKTMTNRKMNKLLAHNGIHSEKMRVGDKTIVRRGIEVSWVLKTMNKQELLNAYDIEEQTAPAIAQFNPGVEND